MSDFVETVQLVDGPKPLEILFPADCRPTLRWLRERQKKREIPYVKLGRLVYFNAVRVQEALAKQPTAKEKEKK
ncbi:MAG TPA: hypothetical protein VME24_13355 [Alphaproteobacteria bacterium]|nr:hypothetical protein [Alphaproteobacteria bacterium]